MAVEILLPKLGLTMQEGTVGEYVVSDGTPVAVGDVIMRVETDKVDVDIESEAAGLFHAAVTAGTTLQPGAVVAWLLAEGEAPPGGAPHAAPVADTAPATGAPESVVPRTAQPAASDPSTAAADGRRFISPNARRVALELGVDIYSVTGTGPEGRVVSEDVREAQHIKRSDGPAAPGGTDQVKPPLRKLARSLGVDLDGVIPSGPDGRISRADVHAAADAAKPNTVRQEPVLVADDAPNQTTKVIPLTGMRGTIASRMQQSLRESAQLTHGYRVCIDGVIAVRAGLKAESAGTDAVVPSINDFVVKAAALALRLHPRLNATVVGGEIRELRDVHVGLAVALPDGLMVPVVRHADRRGLLDIAGETRALAGAARGGKLSLAQLESATFAVTSLGSFGVEFFTPVINPGNVAILGVGQARDGVRWDADVPVRTQEITLSLTFDHRAVDGAPAAQFLRTMDDLLAAPLRLLAG
jgi:pyruvate dehydrogenase E2 component (dihydrolipoyllysine-residue acetyltransferase)